MPQPFGLILIAVGIGIFAIGVLWLVGGAGWLGHLPGDIVIERKQPLLLSDRHVHRIERVAQRCDVGNQVVPTLARLRPQAKKSTGETIHE